ncbi:MAG: tRNA (guanosine(46)-N7)-methyltransferase TrmB [Coprobacillus sp.]|nr:tRNA (guanosine(46)-N7)-methyltransferase TrmB [Coprobacillus sp.]
MRTKYKAWAKPYLEEHSEVVLSQEHFLEMSDYHLEIGSGKGQFLSSMAKKYPDCLFVGVERNKTVAGYCCKRLVTEEVKNALLYPHSIESVLFGMSDECVKDIFLNFSDPWPKKKHHKRRLTSEQYVKEYYRILKTGGCLFLKTDNEELFNFSLEMFKAVPLRLITMSTNYSELDDFDAMTEYEESFRKEGAKIYRLILKK